MGLALTWPRARQLVHFYQPLELPSYDGISKTFTVNSDIDAMLKKVIALIPEEINPSKTKIYDIECINTLFNLYSEFRQIIRRFNGIYKRRN